MRGWIDRKVTIAAFNMALETKKEQYIQSIIMLQAAIRRWIDRKAKIAALKAAIIH